MIDKDVTRMVNNKMAGKKACGKSALVVGIFSRTDSRGISMLCVFGNTCLI